MKHRRLSLIVVLVALVAYLSGFVLGHVDYDETNQATEQFFSAMFLVWPIGSFIGVAVATRRWPSWWLVPAVFAFFFVFPWVVELVERQLEWYPVGVDASYYRLEGMDYMTTSIASVIAIPAVVIALIGVFVARLRLRRIRRGVAAAAVG